MRIFLVSPSPLFWEDIRIKRLKLLGVLRKEGEDAIRVPREYLDLVLDTLGDLWKEGLLEDIIPPPVRVNIKNKRRELL